MTRNRHSGQVVAESRAVRGNRFARLVWTRALPGSVAVVAALTIPEFSVGAGDLGVGNRDDNRVEPPSAAGQGTINWQASGAKGRNRARKEPLAGVRYAGLLDIAPAHQRIALPTAAAALPDRTPTPDAAKPDRTPIPDAALSASSQPSEAARDLIPFAPVADQLSASSQVIAPAPLPVETPLAFVLVDPPLVQLPTADVMLGDTMAFAPIPIAASDPPPSAALVAAPAPAVSVSGLSASRTPPGGRGGIEQMTPTLAAAPAAAPAPAMAAPSPQPVQGAAPALQTASAALALAPAPPALARAAVPAKPPSAPPAARPASEPAAPVTAPLAAAVPAAATPPGLGTSSAAPFALAITARLITRVDGKAAGTVDFQQTATGLKVRLGSIVEVLGDRYDRAQIARIQSSAASNVYLSLAELQAEGVPISYDPVYDEFNVGLSDTRPKAARKVHIDQISAPERGLGTTAIDQMPRN